MLYHKREDDAMRNALMIYLKDMNLVFFTEGNADLANMLNIQNAFAIKCDRLMAHHQGNDIEIRLTKTNDDEKEIKKITYTGKIIAVVWE